MAKFRPSSATRWIACPGSIRAGETAQAQPSSEAAAVGTALHALAEACLKRRVEPSTYIGEPLRALADERDRELVPDRKVSEADAQLVAVYVHHVQAATTSPAGLFVEVRLTLTPELAGTADAVVVTECEESGCRTVEVVDLKTGHNDVSSDCEQLKIYGLAAARKFGADRVLATIVQPNTKAAPETTEYSWPDLEDWYTEVVESAMADAASEAPRFQAGDHCRYCPAASTCEALQAHLAEQAQVDFAPVPEEGAIVPVEGPTDVDQLVRIVQARGQVLAFLNACEEALMARAMAGESLPGLKLVRGRTNRRWVDERSAFRALGRLGVPAKERRETKLKSPAKVEKLLRGSDIPTAKARDFLERHTERPEGAIKLVPEDDKREAFDPAPQFQALPDLSFLD